MPHIPKPVKYGESVSTITPTTGQEAGKPKASETKGGGKK